MRILPFFPILLTGWLLLSIPSCLMSQAVFQTSGAGTGNWNDPASWTLVSGSTSNSYPVAGDTATISSSAAITVNTSSQCNQLTVSGGASLSFTTTSSILTVSNGMTVSGASQINLSLGILTITGNMTVSGASAITVNQGALTVLGLLALNAPGSAGTTLLDVEGGAFSCVGLMTITGSGGTRYAELRINSGSANLAGGLVTVTANAKIGFTGSGTLTLAGSINISNTSSFTPGTGRVIYFGIPGSNQTVAALTYYRLVISGLGGGLKQVNGPVIVTDSLTLLTDTLSINSGGSLTLNDGITIIRTAGHLISAPTFLGTANLVYNDIAKDTTGAEMPGSAGTIQNLTISDIGGIQLGANATVNNSLTLQQGPLLTDPYTLTLANSSGGSGSDPAVSRTNGYIVGRITRLIGASTGLRTFPLGIDNTHYRQLDLEYTSAPATPGSLTVWHIDSAAPAQTGFPLTDNGVTVTHAAPIYWQADAAGGLSGGAYSLTLTDGNAAGVTDITTLRILKRPSTGGNWILDGTDGAHSGTTTTPIIGRTGMSGFSQFSIGSDNGNTLPVSLLSFTATPGGISVTLQWETAAEQNNLRFILLHSIDNKLYEDLASIPGAGTTTTEHIYSYIHSPAAPGTHYYRLQQQDADGRSTYSPIITCTIRTGQGLTLYPNPAVAVISIMLPDTQDGPLILLDRAGQKLGALHPGVNDISRLAAGLYYVSYKKALYSFTKF